MKTKASYLNLDCSASISASWDIPAGTLACNQNTSEKINGSWNFFISSQDGFTVGLYMIIKDPSFGLNQCLMNASSRQLVSRSWKLLEIVIVSTFVLIVRF